MVEIEYKGGNTVVISTKKSKLVTDPKLSILGQKDYSVKASIMLATEDRFAVDDSEAALSVHGPGEYEVTDFSIRGISARRHLDAPDQGNKATIYRIEVEDVRIGLIGNVSESLSDAQQEALGVLDIAIIPVGGNGYTLDSVGATKLARSIDAKIVIPVHYADSALKYEVLQDDLELFKKEFGGVVEEVSRYKIKSASMLPQAATILEISRS